MNSKFAWFSGLKLRMRVTLGVVIPLVVILTAFNALEFRRHRTVVLNSLSLLATHSTTVIERNLRQQMLKSNFGEIQELLNSFDSSSEFRVIYLLNREGVVIFAPNRKGVGTRLDNSAPDCQPCHRLPADQRPGSIIVDTEDGTRVFRSMHPIENSAECSGCHGKESRYIGLLLTDIPTAPVEKPMIDHLYESLLWWTGVLVVIVLVVNLVLDQLVLGRLGKLAGAMKSFGQGQLSTLQIPESKDEIGQLSSTFQSMTAQVEARRVENEDLSACLQHELAQRGVLLRQLITAQEDERKRLARELHDELGQALSGLAFRAEAIHRLVETNPKRAGEELTTMKTLITETTDQMYDLIVALRPSILDDLGLVAAIRAHAERLLRDTGIEFQMNTLNLPPRLPPEIETSLYRTFQEALNNILRHSGATRVEVSLSCANNTLLAEIVDNGSGFDPRVERPAGPGRNGKQSGGMGLLGIKERISLIDGSFDVSSLPGAGVRLKIEIPLPEVDSE